MSRIAINASDALFEAMGTREVPIDLIKVPLSAYPENKETMKRALAYRHLLLHPFEKGLIDVTRWKPEEALNQAGLTDLLHLTGTPSLSTHAYMEYSEVPEEAKEWDGMKLREEAHGVIVRNCGRLRGILDGYKPGTPLLLENHSATPWATCLSFTSTPDFLNEVAREAGAEILLDLAHARISAWHAGVPAKEYVSMFDLDLVGELHVSGPRVYKGLGMLDEHNALADEDWDLLEWVLGRTRPRIISLEYGGMGNDYKAPDGRLIECERNIPDLIGTQVGRLLELTAEYCQN